MDAFYAAVETLSNPLLKGKPMAVGSMSMLSTANYEVCLSIYIHELLHCLVAGLVAVALLF